MCILATVKARIFVLICITFFLQSCLLTDDFKSSLIENHELDDIRAKIDTLDNSNRSQELEKDIEEFNALKPSLQRLIKLESDLAYLAETMRESKVSVQLDNRSTKGKNVKSQLPSMEEVLESQADILPSRPSEFLARPTEANSLTAFTDTPEQEKTSSIISDAESTGQLKLGKALPIIKSMPTDQQMDKKFSSSSTSEKTFVKSDIDKKFRELKENSNNSNTSDQCLNLANNSGKYSLHLASYKTEKSARQGWDSLSDKYSSIVCSLNPKIQTVDVKGIKYLSLRAGPIANRHSVDELCQEIRAKGDYCAISEFSGVSL